MKTRRSLSEQRRAVQAALDHLQQISAKPNAPRIDVGAVAKRARRKSSGGEAAVLRAVSKLVRTHPMVATAERRNSGATWNPGGQFVRFHTTLKGADTVLDIEGVLKDGRRFGLECKRPDWKAATRGERYEREQRQWERIQEIRKLGGRAGFVRSVDEAMRVLG